MLCVLLAFGDRPELEEEFQREHAASRTRHDAVRAFLRLAAWLGFAARAAAHGAAAATVAPMAAAAAAYSLALLVLLWSRPAAFLRCGLGWPGCMRQRASPGPPGAERAQPPAPASHAGWLMHPPPIPFAHGCLV